MYVLILAKAFAFSDQPEQERTKHFTCKDIKSNFRLKQAIFKLVDFTPVRLADFFGLVYDWLFFLPQNIHHMVPDTQGFE